jgi:hypothetical protein
MITISDILDCWGSTTVHKLLRAVSDSDVLALAAQAAILLGQRAKEREREDVEQACFAFLTFLNRERVDTTNKTYRMTP